MFTLIGLGVSVAYLYSLIAVLFPYLFPAAMRNAEGAVSGYFEAAAVIVTLVLLGQVMELGAGSRTGAAIRALLGLSPEAAGGSATTAPKTTFPLSMSRGDRLTDQTGEKVRSTGSSWEDKLGGRVHDLRRTDPGAETSGR